MKYLQNTKIEIFIGILLILIAIFDKILIGEMSMKKLILKTSLITVGAIVALIFIVYGVFALFFPIKIANFLDNIGLEGLSASYYQLHYESTGDVNDLGFLCVKIDEEENPQLAEKFLILLVQDVEFENYLEQFDKNSSATMSGREYFYSKLVIASFKMEKCEQAVNFAKECVDKGYTELNPFYVALCSNVINSEDALVVKNTLIEINNNLSQQEEQFILRDLEVVESLLG